MNTSDQEKTVQFDEPEIEEVRTAARRLQEYSTKALAIAAEVDRIHVKHTQFTQALGAMDRLFQIAPLFEMTHGMRLVGPPGSGKSALFRYFRNSLPRSSLFAPGYGAVGVRAGRRPTAGQLIAALLRAYRYPFRSGGSATVYGRSGIVFDLIREKGTRMLFIDEAQHLLRQTRRTEQVSDEPEATDLLREIVDTNKVALVLAGTEVLDGLGTADHHLADRVPGRHALSHFGEGAAWRGFLRAYSKQCDSHDLSIIDSVRESGRLHIATSGNPRAVKRLITEAVLISADAGKQGVDEASLGSAFRVVFGTDTLMRNPYAA